MLQDCESAYYLRREASARNLATKASDPTISRIHADMAERYAALAQETGRTSAHVR